MTTDSNKGYENQHRPLSLNDTTKLDLNHNITILGEYEPVRTTVNKCRTDDRWSIQRERGEAVLLAVDQRRTN